MPARLSPQFRHPTARLAANRGRGGSSFLTQARVTFVELLHLSVGAPTVVAVPRGAQMGVASRFEAARQVVLRRQFVGESLVLDEAVLARRMDSLLVETQGIGVSLFDAGDLGQYQRVLVGEGGWIVFGPLAQLFPVLPSGVRATLAARSADAVHIAPTPSARCNRNSRVAAIWAAVAASNSFALSAASSASA